MNNKKNSFFFIFWILLAIFNSKVFANNQLIEELLYLNNTEYEESQLTLVNTPFEYIDKVRVDSSYKRDINRPDQQSVSARVYPKNFTTYKLEKQHFYTQQEYVNTNLNREQIALQEKNYALLVEAKFQKKLIDFLKRTIQLYQDELKAKKMLTQGKFYVESIFFINRKLQLLNLKLLKQKQLYNSRLRAIQSTLNNRYNSEKIRYAIESYQLNSADVLIEKMKQSNFQTLLTNSIDSQIDEQKKQIIEENLKLEQQKEEFTFDFVELGYNNKVQQSNSINIGFGVDLPLKRSNQVKIMEEKVALLELHEKDRVEDELYLREAKLILNEALSLYEYRNGLSSVIENDNFYKIYSQKEDADPRFILEVQEKKLDEEEELIGVEKQLHQNYIKLLVLTHGFSHPILSPLSPKEL